MVGVQNNCSKHSNGFTRKNGLKIKKIASTDILNQKCFLGEAERDIRTPPPPHRYVPYSEKKLRRIPLSKADDGSEHVKGYSDYELFPNQISTFLAIDVELKHVRYNRFHTGISCYTMDSSCRNPLVYRSNKIMMIIMIYCFFRGSGPVLLRNPIYIFVIF